MWGLYHIWKAPYNNFGFMFWLPLYGAKASNSKKNYLINFENGKSLKNRGFWIKLFHTPSMSLTKILYLKHCQKTKKLTKKLQFYENLSIISKPYLLILFHYRQGHNWK